MAKRKPSPILPEKLCLSYLRKSSMLFMHFTGDGILRYANPAAEKAFRLSGKHGFEFLPEIVRAALINGENYFPLRVEYGGQYYSLSFYRGVGIVVEGHEVTGLCREIKKLQLDLQHDELTGLPKRNYFKEVFSMAVSNARRHNKNAEEKRTKEKRTEPAEREHVALYAIDLNNFKELNDTHGHKFGDEFLLALADRFRETILRRGTDVVARAGGDEFWGLATSIRSEKDARMFAEKIIEGFKAPLVIRGNRIQASMAIGIRVVDVEKENLDLLTLMEQADLAMYQGKKKASYLVYRHGRQKS